MITENAIRDAFEHNEPGKYLCFYAAVAWQNTRPMLNWAHRPAGC